MSAIAHLTTFDFAFLAFAIVLTSIISGIFGSSGGSLLLGALLLKLDVSTSMVVFSISQMSSNVWRAAVWFRHIHWLILWKLIISAFVTTALMSLTNFVPNKAFIFLCLGAIPLLASMAPKALVPDITRPGAAYVCGSVVMILLLMAGATGGLLDLFFQKSTLSRKTVVATKAAAQTVTLALRMAYFGAFAAIQTSTIPIEFMAGAVLSSLIGILFSALILNRMSDLQFRRYSGIVINSLGVVFLGRGLWLLVNAS